MELLLKPHKTTSGVAIVNKKNSIIIARLGGGLKES
jgi:hypothetical protein